MRLPGQTVALGTKDNADPVQQLVVLFGVEPGEGRKGL